MTDGPLKSTMCCRGQGRRGSGGVHSSSFGAFGLAGSDSGSRGRGAPLAFRLLPLFFPPPCPRVGGEKLPALSSTPQAYRDLLGLEQAAAPLFPLDIHGAFAQDIFLKTCNLLSGLF
ncbi:hypothetical protein KUCAC02_002307 [Chaenocephalus aceratus]|uniref:Uncharacterized protein n=1 Tax=Chaenocephalus aceratus TaxID=36190 RepID=A0ACB9XVR3_CHAAC|nr:hypothetical protein KUCAC02_002307 [Chaenocephalus aceratus]